MKPLLVLFYFLLVSTIIFPHAMGTVSSVGLGTGGLTPHFTQVKKNYCNQWNNSGVIANRSYYARIQLYDHGVSYLIGDDSICSRIEGMLYNYTFRHYEYMDVSMMMGGYTYIARNWKKHEEETPSGIDAPQPVSFNAFGTMVVPVLALGVELHLIKGEYSSLKLMNILTPIITNHSLMFEYRF